MNNVSKFTQSVKNHDCAKRIYAACMSKLNVHQSKNAPPTAFSKCIQNIAKHNLALRYKNVEFSEEQIAYEGRMLEKFLTKKKNEIIAKHKEINESDNKNVTKKLFFEEHTNENGVRLKFKVKLPRVTKLNRWYAKHMMCMKKKTAEIILPQQKLAEKATTETPPTASKKKQLRRRQITMTVVLNGKRLNSNSKTPPPRKSMAQVQGLPHNLITQKQFLRQAGKMPIFNVACSKAASKPTRLLAKMRDGEKQNDKNRAVARQELKPFLGESVMNRICLVAPVRAGDAVKVKETANHKNEATPKNAVNVKHSPLTDELAEKMNAVQEKYREIERSTALLKNDLYADYLRNEKEIVLQKQIENKRKIAALARNNNYTRYLKTQMEEMNAMIAKSKTNAKKTTKQNKTAQNGKSRQKKKNSNK